MCRPVRHQLAPSFEHVGSGVGSLGAVTHDVGQRPLRQLAGNAVVRALGPERSSEAVNRRVNPFSYTRRMAARQ